MTNSKSERSNTGYKGITFAKDRGLFQAQVVAYNNKPHDRAKIKEKAGVTQTTVWSRSNFPTLKEAVKAREDYIKSLF